MPRGEFDGEGSSIGERMARVETARSHLEKAVDDMAKSVRDGFQKVEQQITDLRDTVEQRARTDWKLVISIVSAVAVVLGLAGSLTGYLVLRPIYDGLAEAKAQDAAGDVVDAQHDAKLVEIETIIRTRRGIFTDPKPPP